MPSTFILIKSVGVLGLLLICTGMIVRHRTMRDVFSMCGGTLLFIYSLYLGDIIFIILQAVFVLVTAFDFVNKKMIQHTND